MTQSEIVVYSPQRYEFCVRETDNFAIVLDAHIQVYDVKISGLLNRSDIYGDELEPLLLYLRSRAVGSVPYVFILNGDSSESIEAAKIPLNMVCGDINSATWISINEHQARLIQPVLTSVINSFIGEVSNSAELSTSVDVVNDLIVKLESACNVSLIDDMLDNVNINMSIDTDEPFISDIDYLSHKILDGHYVDRLGKLLDSMAVISGNLNTKLSERLTLMRSVITARQVVNEVIETLRTSATRNNMAMQVDIYMFTKSIVTPNSDTANIESVMNSAPILKPSTTAEGNNISFGINIAPVPYMGSIFNVLQTIPLIMSEPIIVCYTTIRYFSDVRLTTLDPYTMLSLDEV